MVYVRTFFRRLGRLFSRELSAPFENLGPPFGDPVPPDLRAFEVDMEEHENRPVTHVAPSDLPPEHTKPSDQDHRPPHN
jgi:hypothetical protein